MTVVGALAGVLLGAAALLVCVRLSIGPSVLDRLVSMDVLLSVTACGIGVYAAVTRDSTVVPVLVVVSLLGFVGSASVARFIPRDAPPQPKPARAQRPRRRGRR
ncbi:monovalent cation/H+ antiporter complex subunit F [Motilibacter aurantiacus]|uniref:monovalent cation/H+ antiporter complex subunit F n=1 Tax=Motilibacter aurantiacus TaxID=2714955 RepID=UPI0014077AA1|nr:monovalent cation/H+ antiporter complex subunit F [Motilibacter aurantiacus]NHC46971.1 pH regulation protein F [Motilibacter aurantiacus]